MMDSGQWDEDVPCFEKTLPRNQENNPDEVASKHDVEENPLRSEEQEMSDKAHGAGQTATWKKALGITGGVLVLGFGLILGYQMFMAPKPQYDPLLTDTGPGIDPLAAEAQPAEPVFDPLTGEMIGETPEPPDTQGVLGDPTPQEAAEAAEPAAEQPPALPQARTLSEVLLSDGQMVILGDGVVDGVNHFTMTAPARLVIDIPGVKTAFDNHSFPAPIGWKAVRVGRDNQKVRIVLEASGSILPETTVETNSDRVTVAWTTPTKAKPVVESTPAAVRDGALVVDQERLAFLERERTALRRQLQAEQERTRRLQQDIRSLTAKSDQQGIQISELRSTVATLKKRPVLPPGWQVVGLTTQQVIFSDGSKTHAVRVGESSHGMTVQSVDVKNGRITTNFGTIEVPRGANGNS